MMPEWTMPAIVWAFVALFWLYTRRQARKDRDQ